MHFSKCFSRILSIRLCPSTANSNTRLMEISMSDSDGLFRGFFPGNISICDWISKKLYLRPSKVFIPQKLSMGLRSPTANSKSRCFEILLSDGLLNFFREKSQLSTRTTKLFFLHLAPNTLSGGYSKFLFAKRFYLYCCFCSVE